MAGEPLKQLVPEAFALVIEATYRTFGYRQHDVQILGGIAMQDLRIVSTRNRRNGFGYCAIFARQRINGFKEALEWRSRD